MMEKLLQETGFKKSGYWRDCNNDEATETGVFAIALQLEPREARDGYAYIAKAISGELKKHLYRLKDEYVKARCCWIKPCLSIVEAENAANLINAKASAGGLTP